MMKPNFFIIGAAKAGTTWLYSCLKPHQQVFIPGNKEIHFFSYDNLFQKGEDWYTSFFEGSAGKLAIGEISPSYLSHQKAPQRIYNFNPSAKIVCILRNPVQRAYSHYCMDLRKGKLSKDIDKGLNLETPYVQWGLYYKQILDFKQYFDNRQLKVFFFDDLKKDPRKLVLDLYSYLDINTNFEPETLYVRKNTAREMPRFPYLYRQLKRIYERLEESPLNIRGMFTQVRLEGHIDFFHNLNRGDSFPAMSEQKEQELKDFYRDDVEKLSCLLERDLLHWTD